MTGQERRKVAIIGAGPGGLATTRVFLENTTTFDIKIFEKDSQIGGVWYYPEDNKEGRVMYDYLETNLSKELMQFSGFPFGEHIRKFPTRNDVYDYLRSYYKRFIVNNERVQIHFNNEVTGIKKVKNEWEVTIKDEEDVLKFDYVVIATGHFTEPNIPKGIPNLEHWFTNKHAFHAKDFQNAEIARGKTIVVIGNGSSGTDIRNQLSTVARKVYNSVNDPSLSSPLDNFKDIIELVPKIIKTNWESRSIELEDGRVLKNVDYLIYATGYLYAFPFFEEKMKVELLGEDRTSKGVHHLWEHLFYQPDPTLAFSLLPTMVVPFPLAELQACVIVKVFTNKLTVSKHTEEDFGNRHGFSFATGEDIDYYRHLQALLEMSGGNDDPFQPVKWDESHKRLRIKNVKDKENRNLLLSKFASELRERKEVYRLPPPEYT
ncbi:N,N-dimethylaniline monooxygenase NDAI_0C03440 [Naumovozyma dairenensis CBS 421]|uniref:FAD/NAD(P)-binding domain-containing protein n=1 Tax=Naumovozyma dairenensis (strain ATCC 10597 / BCRC 20456 / CBS 421 / NBRC 0211 / NRRL Y-12639) TaxID=1071378 RepID=G0W893_NAUDC|nr:hypothetical protein NDAI_0C03440 [Naumovozyma dairenensis CBS 421]CCD24004.1 hypothetical protein NDAI_0C03440 [Naumovozyma dairenensis CBS 421]